MLNKFFSDCFNRHSVPLEAWSESDFNLPDDCEVKFPESDSISLDHPQATASYIQWPGSLWLWPGDKASSTLLSLIYSWCHNYIIASWACTLRCPYYELAHDYYNYRSSIPTVVQASNNNYWINDLYLMRSNISCEFVLKFLHWKKDFPFWCAT